MSTYSEQDHLDPNDPTYYAPRALRARAKLPLSPPNETSSERLGHPVSPAAPFDGFEEAVPEGLRHSLDPEVMQEPPGGERERGMPLIRRAGRLGAAVGVSALLASIFVIMIPASRDQRQEDGASSFPAILQSIKTAFYQPPRRDDDAKPALSELQTIQASTRTSNAEMTHEESEALLQQFVRWRQKADSGEAPQ